MRNCSSSDVIIEKPLGVAGSYGDAVKALAVQIARNIRAQAGPDAAQPSSTR
jgi:hypothetical protein